VIVIVIYMHMLHLTIGCS